MSLPKLFEVDIRHASHRLASPVEALGEELGGLSLAGRLKPGQRVAVTAGSRGITGIAQLLQTVVAFLRKQGAEVFIFPAMGSHGGATADGQTAMLAHLGVTAESLGAPIRSSTETVMIGTSDEGVPVHQDRQAHEADWVVVVNRVKRHTGFSGLTGSGLLKMLSIGMGKPTGAKFVHSFGPVLGYENAIQSAGRTALHKTNILFGVALVEDAFGETAEVRVCGPERFQQTDRELLARSLTMMPRLPVEDIDLLIVDWMGKNISGTGMDTHTIGRLRTLGSPRPTSPRVKRVFVRDLTPESGGNAIGIGLADFTTDRLVEKMDYAATCTNCLTSMSPEQAQIPIHYASDRECIDRALGAIGPASAELRIVRIQDTSHLSRVVVSEAVLDELRGRDDVSVSEQASWAFDDDGKLL